MALLLRHRTWWVCAGRHHHLTMPVSLQVQTSGLRLRQFCQVRSRQLASHPLAAPSNGTQSIDLGEAAARQTRSDCLLQSCPYS